MDAVKETKVVQLKKAHTHNGVLHPPGFFLGPLEAKVADWLIEQGIALESRAAPTHQAPRIATRGCCGGRW